MPITSKHSQFDCMRNNTLPCCRCDAIGYFLMILNRSKGRKSKVDSCFVLFFFSSFFLVFMSHEIKLSKILFPFYFKCVKMKIPASSRLPPAGLSLSISVSRHVEGFQERFSSLQAKPTFWFC